MTSFQPTRFDAPLVNPSPNGLVAAVNWQTDGGPPRWIAGGVDVGVFNYGGAEAFGVWGADWCAAEEDLQDADVKLGTRPDMPDTFVAMTVWAADECDMTPRGRHEVRTRAQQVLRLREPVAAETEFAARLLADGPAPQTAPTLKAAVGYLEGELARTGTLGVIHAGAQWASQEFGLVNKSGTRLVSPLGHTWVFGGGYVDTLENTLVATSPLFGWRDEVDVREVMQLERNRYLVVAERSMVIGYEAVVAAVTIQ